ncbi:hypothetical protein [Sphingobium sp. SYK-6]|uniref:hypothetical protein n=1 Tax=Sphingobium sp. (strain NBRC 103272 / SYK-6) TaxID=627192 RepID=UPI0011D22271|nr:hypothetical protein [Sphingobium sp. SYK-6]
MKVLDRKFAVGTRDYAKHDAIRFPQAVAAKARKDRTTSNALAPHPVGARRAENGTIPETIFQRLTARSAQIE